MTSACFFRRQGRQELADALREKMNLKLRYADDSGPELLGLGARAVLHVAKAAQGDLRILNALLAERTTES